MSREFEDRAPIIGEAPSFLAMLEHVSAAAPMNKPVLVIGERGTGKELIASRLHYLSPRWDQLLTKINCAALTESLLESELFGHEAGAFTGATRTHIGQFEQAEGGTLVLDELGTIPKRSQEKILRVIEYGEFRRVGGSKTLQTDVRVVGVSNENLPELAARGEFRADLLDRLAFDVIHLPPLRARPEDIMTLAHHFAVTLTSELKREYFPGFSPQATATLVSADWPGNVRELKNTVERSIYRSRHPDQPVQSIITDPFDSVFCPPTASAPGVSRQEFTPERAAKTAVANAAGRPTQIYPLDLKAEISALELELLKGALKTSYHNQRVAAELLGLSYHQLRGLVRKYGGPEAFLY